MYWFAELMLLPNFLEEYVRSFLINKNLALYYWLKKRIGKNLAFGIVNHIERVITIFGREEIPEQQKSVLERAYQENRME